ncbi:MAG: magnesium transporter CorA family protein [Legionellaceae bacterium]|nr:magnesium transporter CorA family protein [Legionellaceae bacterium]
MLTFLNKHGFQQGDIDSDNAELIKDSIWVDMVSPSAQEYTAIEEYLGFKIPSRAEMVEIELSSRLYVENDTLFMTAAMISDSDSPNPTLDPVTFILTANHLITIRYIEPRSFVLFKSRVKKMGHTYDDALGLLIEVLEVTVDRLADILEYIGHGVDEFSKKIFHARDTEGSRDYRKLLQEIAASSDLNTKTQESLVTFNRLVAYLTQVAGGRVDKDNKAKLATLRKDILSLSHHTHFLSTKVSFLLDATLGLVSIEQNNIIKIFSVAAVIFLPPTLIASIYGMNFKFIPELSWRYGYAVAIGLMFFAAWAPFKYFKHKKWL